MALTLRACFACQNRLSCRFFEPDVILVEGSIPTSSTSIPYKTSRLSPASQAYIGGEGGIRTLDARLAHTRFPGVLLRPLGHLSNSHRRDGRRPSLPLIAYLLLGLAALAAEGAVTTLGGVTRQASSRLGAFFGAPPGMS